jgi:hypothetical protein
MRNRLIALLVITPVLFSSQIPTSQAAAKAGAKCTKVGSKSYVGTKTFTCIKSGKKLVWNKGITALQTVKNDDAPVKNEMQPVKEDIYQRWERTGSNATKFLNVWRASLATGKPETQITFWFGATVPPEIKAEAERRFNNTVLQWERFYKVSRSKVYFDLGMLEDHSARCEVLSKRSVHFPVDWCLQDDPRKRNLIYWASAFNSEGGFRPTIEPMLSKDASVSHSYTLFEPAVMYLDAFIPRIEHEWFHQVQYDLAGNDYMHENPMWFQEGAAEYFGLLSGSASDPNYFIQHRAQNWFSHNANHSVDFFKDWIIRHDLPRLAGGKNGERLQTRAGENTMYSYGAFLTEWMVGKIGLPGLLKLMKDTESIGWQKAFTNNMGRSSSDLLTEMANYLYTENKIISDNKWIFLPMCKSYATDKIVEFNKGVCNSNGSNLT